MLSNYYFLLKSTSSFFIFSISSIFFSAPGQTFLISLAIPSICLALAIDPLQFAVIYSTATLLASFMLPFIGKKIDIWPASKSVLYNACFFSSALILFAFSTKTIALFIALFFMRLFGQGAFTLNSTSHTIKRFPQYRGSALSLTHLGYPLSEFFFPSVFMFLLLQLGLSKTFVIFSISILCIYLPIALFGLKRTQEHSFSDLSDVVDEESKSLAFVFKDPFFPIYVLLSAIPPIMMTAALYFQMDIFKLHQWPIESIAMAISSYALFKFLSTLFVGPLIDRIGIVFPLSMLTLAIGLATSLIYFKGSISLAYLYYSLFGIGIGASGSTMSYLWGLLYGSEHIAQIKGVIAIIRNGGTALSPVLFSYFIYSHQYSIQMIFYFSGLFIIFLGLTPFVVRFFDKRLKPTSI